MIVISKTKTFECSMFQFVEKSKAIVFCNEKKKVIHEIKNCIQEDYDTLVLLFYNLINKGFVDIRALEDENHILRRHNNNDPSSTRND